MTSAGRILGVAAFTVALTGCGSPRHTTTGVEPTETVRIYLLHGGKVQPIKRSVRFANAAAAWQQLAAGPTPAEEKIGLASAVVDDPGSKLSTEADGTPLLRTVEQPRAAVAQIVYTIAQFGGPGGAVAVNDAGYRKAAFEDLTPAILVESPLPETNVGRPLRIAGTANTFEATFQYELVDAAGKVIAHHFATATSGSGTRGTFDVTIPYPAGHAGRGELVVYESSAKDGSRIHVVEIPVRLSR